MPMKAIKETKVEKIIVSKKSWKRILAWQEGRDFWWQELVEKESIECEPEIMDSEDPLFILYTSGSTGKPKGCRSYYRRLRGSGVLDNEMDI